MRFLRAMGRYGMTTLVLLCGRAIGQETVSVPADMVAYPDMIVYNGKIVTMDDTSFGLNRPVGTMAQAMAIRDAKIQAIGTTDRILRMAGPRTDKMDLKGRMVMPGIINTHVHTHNDVLNNWLGKHPEAMNEVATSYTVSGKTDEELVKAITLTVQEHVRNTPAGRWATVFIAGGSGSGLGIGVRFLAEKKYTKQMLDPLAPQHPVILISHPSYVGNTAFVGGLEKLFGRVSLAAAGIDDVGRVRSTASQYRRELVVDMYFKTRVPLLADIVEDGLRKNAAVGVTTYVSHIMGERFLDAFNLLVRQKRMPTRFAYTHWFGFSAGYAETATFYRRMGDMDGMGTDYFWNNGVGLGSIDSGPPRFCSTMEAPREIKDLEWCQNAEGTREYETTKTAIANYQRVQVGHAYADKGVDYFLDAVEAAMKENPAITLDYLRSRRLSSDHCGFYPRVPQIPRMAKFGMMISCGANVLTRSYPWIGPGKFAPQYIKQIAPIRSAIEGGVPVTLEGGTGVNEKMQTQGYFAGAVPFLTRKNRLGAMVSPEEAVDRNTLLKMMTSWAARFVMKEDVLGTLEPGKWADFLVLSKDYFEGPPEAIAGVYPLMTVVGGKIAVLKEEFARELGRGPVGPQVQFVSAMDEVPSAPE